MTTRLRIQHRDDLARAPIHPETGHYDLTGADMAFADLAGINFANCIFTGADLEGATLERCNLENAHFEGANLAAAIFVNANLFSSNLTNADLADADLRNAILVQSNLTGADLTEADLQNVNLRDSNLRGANLEAANLRNAYLLRANLEGANLQEASLRGAILFEANLRGADLRRSNLNGASLLNANIEGANIEGLNADLIATALRRDLSPEQRLRVHQLELRVQARAPARAPARAQEGELGAAFDIHNAYDKINVPDLIYFFKNKIENQRQLLLDLYRMSTTDFLNNVINANMTNFLSKLTPEELNSIPNKPEGYYPDGMTTWEHIWHAIYNDRLTQISFNDAERRKLIGLAITYASKQPVPFQVSYVLCYLDENAFGYSSARTFARNFSCGKGFLERFVTCLKAGIDTMLTTELPEDLKIEYKMLKTKILGGYDVEVAKRLITEWQNDNKNIITENGEFRANKEELVAQQKDHLFHYLCCELGVTQEELMRNAQVRQTIDYMFGDDNILDNTLGGRKKKTRSKKIGQKKIKRITKRSRKTKRIPNKLRKTKKDTK